MLQEEAYLREAIRQSLEDAKNPPADGKKAPEPTVDLLDFGGPTPAPALPPSAPVPNSGLSIQSDPFGASRNDGDLQNSVASMPAAAPSNGYANDFAALAAPGALVAAAPSGYGSYGAPAATSNPYGVSNNPYETAYGVPATSANVGPGCKFYQIILLYDFWTLKLCKFCVGGGVHF